MDIVASLVDFLSEKLKVQNNKFGIYRSDGSRAEMIMPISVLMHEYGIDKPNVVKFAKSPNRDETLAYVEEYVSDHCNLPSGCFRFFDPPMTHLETIQD